MTKTTEKAAIYGRKSTDDSDRNAENKSVTRQVEHAKAFAQSKGWEVDEEHVYVDDNVSGAEYQNRPGLARLMANLQHFDVLIMSESSRLGRDMTRNAAFVVGILESDVRIFYYLSGEEEKADTPEQKIVLTLRSYASEVERLKASQRSRDALERKARKGLNTGGVVFGYDNVPVYDGDTKRCTDYKINAQQADTVRRMFRMYAQGHGVGKIARTMNSDPRYATLSERYFDGMRPSSPRKGTGSWAPSSVRAILLNERYAGVISWGEQRKAYRKGTKTRVKQAPEHILQALRPDLRIIDEKLWADVQGRFSAVRKSYLRDTKGNLWGRPGMGVESRYLLTGLGRCDTCGANIKASAYRSGSPGKRRPLSYYECGYNRHRGSTVCANNHRARVELADALVLDTIERTLLTREAVDGIVERALELVAEQRAKGPDLAEHLEASLREDKRTLDNFLRAIGQGSAPASVLAEIRRLEAAIADRQARLSGLTAEIPSELALQRLKKAAYTHMGEFKDLIYSDVPLARQALRKLLPEPIRFVPQMIEGKRGFMLYGETKAGAIFSACPTGASPRGFEPRLPP